MRTLIVGSGPTGLLLGAALARRGQKVVSVDRDPGPVGDAWIRRGVMQFEHAHGFRPQVPMALEAEWPEAHRSWKNLGAQPVEAASSAGSRQVVGMLSRRSTFERALRHEAKKAPHLTLRRGHVEGLVEVGGRVVGARVDGFLVEADLVVDASGRAGRLGKSATRSGKAELDGDCGLAYLDRTFRLRPGAEPGPMVSPLAYMGDFDGYQCVVFLHEEGHFSVVIVRPTAEAALKALRFEKGFEAACRAIPALAEWTHPARALPTSAVLVGGALRNVYRRQAGTPGLVTVGDSMATTTPTRGRGIAMACMQVTALIALLDEGADPVSVAEPFGAWSDHAIEPWVADHIAIDGGMVRRWQGEDLDLSIPLTSDLIADAVEADPRIGQHAGGYFAMTALPETLRPAEPLARAVYRAGWRPRYAPGPTRGELVDVIHAALPPAWCEPRDQTAPRKAADRSTHSSPVCSCCIPGIALLTLHHGRQQQPACDDRRATLATRHHGTRPAPPGLRLPVTDLRQSQRRPADSSTQPMEIVMSNTVIQNWWVAWATRLGQRSAAVVVAASMLLVGCGSEDPTPPTTSPDDHASASATSEASATAEAPAVSPLEGSWQAGPISLQQTEATVRRHGLSRYVKDYRANAPFFGDTVLTLTIEDGAWDLYGKSGGGQPAPIDYDAEYEIDRGTVVFHHSNGSNTYRWQVDQDTLALHFVKSTLPGYRGIPDEVFQRALYMTEAFTRQD